MSYHPTKYIFGCKVRDVSDFPSDKHYFSMLGYFILKLMGKIALKI